MQTQGPRIGAIVIHFIVKSSGLYSLITTGQLLVGFLSGFPWTLIITAYFTRKNDKQISGNRKTLSRDSFYVVAVQVC